jgi:ribosomal peptide maturation radical SAM protein 1
MYRIALINMPLGNLALPSIPLTQLSAVTRARFGERVKVEVHYLSHDFAHYLTRPAYQELVSFAHHPTGLGEWFFRQAAFPELPDNSDAYFQRYYPQHDPRNRLIAEFVREKRQGVVEHFQALIDRYALDRADLVGFTSMFSQNVATLAMARLIRQRNPGCTIVMGGANCEAPMGRELADQVPWMDFVFSGPSLKSFPELVRCLMEGDADAAHRIHGVFSRRNRVDDCIAHHGPAPSTSAGEIAGVRAFGDDMDINEPVALDYGPFLDAYEESFPDAPQPQLFFETSRGCWWGERAHCTFCGLNGSTMAYRAMAPALALRVLDGLFQYGDRVTHLQSVDNILPRSYLADVLPYLDTPPHMDLFYEVKADLEEDDFRVLSRARVKLIQPGIEALNTGTLKRMRKGTSSFHNLQFLINCVRYDISPGWNLLIGFPGEEIAVYDKYLEDLPLLTHLPPPGGVFPVRFDRYSPYHVEAAEYGLQLTPLDWYVLTFPYPPEALERLAYYFADGNPAAPYMLNVARRVGKLREAVADWAALWDDPAMRPRLELREHGSGHATVFDSRAGEPREYRLDDGARRLLHALEQPKKLANLLKELPDVDVEAELETLRRHALVFQENERILGLVVPPPTPVALRHAELAAAAA